MRSRAVGAGRQLSKLWQIESKCREIPPRRASRQRDRD
jgi:hypothetical protein